MVVDSLSLTFGKRRLRPRAASVDVARSRSSFCKGRSHNVEERISTRSESTCNQPAISTLVHVQHHCTTNIATRDAPHPCHVTTAATGIVGMHQCCCRGWHHGSNTGIAKPPLCRNQAALLSALSFLEPVADQFPQTSGFPAAPRGPRQRTRLMSHAGGTHRSGGVPSTTCMRSGGVPSSAPHPTQHRSYACTRG